MKRGCLGAGASDGVTRSTADGRLSKTKWLRSGSILLLRGAAQGDVARWSSASGSRLPNCSTRTTAWARNKRFVLRCRIWRPVSLRSRAEERRQLGQVAQSITKSDGHRQHAALRWSQRGRQPMPIGSVGAHCERS